MGSDSGQTISWNVVTHVHKERSVDWYWAFGIITVVAAGVSIWLGNTLFAIVLLLGAGSLAVLLARGPREHSIHIDNRGIAIDGTMHRFNTVHSFWVDHIEHLPEGVNPRLYLTTSGIIMPRFTLALENKHQADQVRSWLKRFVTEEEQHPHLGEHLAEILGL